MAKKKTKQIRNKKQRPSGSAESDVGLIGLAVMGQNLVLNMADHGYRVSVYNRTTSKMTDFIEQIQGAEPSADRVVGHRSLKAFVESIRRPRKIILLVKAGGATDATIESVLPLLEKGDIVVDGGNAQWTDIIRREKELKNRGLHFVGSGVSGGELGARFGPSLMPGGSQQAWKSLRPIWEAIAAKVDPKTGKPHEDYAPGQPITEGEPCTAHIGSDGAGHYVKMVHNGIEYIDMQLICESYMLMKTLLGMKPDAMSEVFGRWNEGDLDSFLIEITADILQQRDPTDKKRFLVDRILDTAGQKGTGKWTSISA
ncbi:MAG: NADP-dependent phosphogluconate dehydrogenase, partial [Phycisphaeraceae bacterium]|nr:NADP-dependent phosphogluconate dehydrogenase [Phycisphaeraceae bacterium]